jgi:hypothetical protein
MAWLVGLVMWLYKRRRRQKRIAAGTLLEDEKPDQYIIPPDPAVLSGQYTPGQTVVPPRKSHKSKAVPDMEQQT